MRRAVLLAVVAGIAACDDDRAPRVAIEVPTLSAGTHRIVVDGDDVAFGTALVGEDGRAYLVLGDDSELPASAIYRRDAAADDWRRVPAATEDVALSLRLAEAEPAAALPPAAARLQARVGMARTRFSLQQDGAIAAGASGCALSGRLDAHDAGFAAVDLSLAGCGEADGAFDGVAFVDSDAPNAALRIVADDGVHIRDFHAFVDPQATP